MSRVEVARPARGPTTLVAAAVLAVAAAAWLALVLGGHGHAAGPAAPVTHDHGSMAAAAPVGIGPVLAGWALMVVAMMLPPALPLAGVLARLLARHRPGLGITAGLAAFVAVWVGVGVLLITGDAVIDSLTGPWTVDARTRLAGALVLLAGAYQFAPVKNACLTACRSPRWFALRFWRGRSPVRESSALSAAYAVSCVGCCWALMLLGLGAGALALPVMVVLTVLMTAERLVPGRAVTVLVRASGAVLGVVGVALLAGLVPASLVHPFLGV